jgi:hypothetical protein
LIQEQDESVGKIPGALRLIHQQLDYAKSATKNLLDERIDQYQGACLSPIA